MRIYLLGLVTFTFTACSYVRKPPEVVLSSSKRFILKIDVNRDKTDKAKYGCIVLTLLDTTNKQISTIQTDATDNMKWAVNWYPNKDTIILYSSDIGSRAYHLTDKNRLDTIATTRDIDSIARIIFQKKYENQ